MAEMIEKLSPNDDLSSFYTSLSKVLSNSAVEPKAETNLIEHQTSHNVLRHLIKADGERQKKNKQKNNTCINIIINNFT